MAWFSHGRIHLKVRVEQRSFHLHFHNNRQCNGSSEIELNCIGNASNGISSQTDKSRSIFNQFLTDHVQLFSAVAGKCIHKMGNEKPKKKKPVALFIRRLHREITHDHRLIVEP